MDAQEQAQNRRTALPMATKIKSGAHSTPERIKKLRQLRDRIICPKRLLRSSRRADDRIRIRMQPVARIFMGSLTTKSTLFLARRLA